jgi:hypothetical protein
MTTHEQTTQEVRDAFDALCKGRVKAAVEAEREACAQVVWDMKGKCWAYDHDTIAAAIRDRGNT